MKLTRETDPRFAREVLEVVEQIKPLLAGRGPHMQAAILAECLGLVLAGHWIPGERGGTARVRRLVLDAVYELAWDLSQASASQMGTDK